MKKIATVLLAGGALALAGTAALAANALHHMTVRGPDGTTLQVEYTGNIAPKIEFGSGPATMAADFVPLFTPAAAAPDMNFLSIEAMMDRQMRMMQQHIRSVMTRMPAMNTPFEAAFGAAPSVDNGWSFASLGKGAHFCSRSVAVTVVNGKRHVEQHSSGDCGGANAPAAAHVTGGTGPKLKI